MTEIDAPPVPGVVAGVLSLVTAAVPLAWLGTYALVGALPDSAVLREPLLRAEPVAFALALMLTMLFGCYALARNRRRGRVLAIVAIALAVLEVAAILGLLVALDVA